MGKRQVMKLSVLMATYNGEHFIREQLESICRQTMLPSELVVVDDGSVDGTLQIIESIAPVAEFPIRIFKNERRLGYGCNFLRGVSNCVGDWIAFSDQDDVWLPQKLDRMANAIARYRDLNLVVHEALVCDESLHPSGGRFTGRVNNIWRDRIAGPLGFGYRVFPGFSVCIRRSLLAAVSTALEGHDCTDALLAHDGWATTLGYAVGGTYFIAEPLALYRRHRDAYTSDYRQGLRAKFARIRNTSAETYLRDAARDAQAAVVLSEIAQVAHITERERLRYASLWFIRLKALSEARARLYEQRSFLRRQQLLLWLMIRGTYLAPRKGTALGFSAMLKDLGRAWLGGRSHGL